MLLFSAKFRTYGVRYSLRRRPQFVTAIVAYCRIKASLVVGWNLVFLHDKVNTATSRDMQRSRVVYLKVIRVFAFHISHLFSYYKYNVMKINIIAGVLGSSGNTTLNSLLTRE